MMGDEPILSIIQPVTIDTMLNNNWLNNGLIFLSKKSGWISLCVNAPVSGKISYTPYRK